MEADVDILYRWINPVAGVKTLIRCLLVNPNRAIGQMNCVQSFFEEMYPVRAPWELPVQETA
jgi:hypothetical protein